jgi:ATP adenylyltransferase
MTTCSLCSSLASNAMRESWDNHVFESLNFVALPSLGSLVEGWLLLLPKKHFISLGALPEELVAEMEDMKTKITAHVENEYGQACVFEHGPAFASRKVGCSVDHAHLHVVPFAFNLAEAARPFMPNCSAWAKGSWSECRRAHRDGRDYLYFEQPLGDGSISTHADFGSQIFRKAIASQLGRPAEFNWREYPEFDNIARTINVFAHAAYSIEGISREG